MAERKLSDREKLFCAYYAAGRNAIEAARKAQFPTPQKTADRLMRKQNVLQYIKEQESKLHPEETDLIAGYRRLAFGSANEAVSIILSREMAAEKLNDVDLFNVAEVKRTANGSVEIKFFDRQKALDKLNELTNQSQAPEDDENSIFGAISSSAKALNER